MKAYLILADGTVFDGESIGKSGETIGEVVFTTSMVGYMETITDPSYYGQLITQTFPIIGSYGAIETDAESEVPKLSGYIVRELVTEGSNFRKKGELGEFLTKHNIIGISGIDTRALTRKIRESGVMNGMITTDKKDMTDKLKRIKLFSIQDAVKNTTSSEVETLNKGGKYRVVLYDFGAKGNIERELIKRNAEVIRVPSYTTAEQIMAYKPDGLMLSNGAGDPAENKDIIKELKKLMEKRLPTFGICLGHQLLALAMGGRTEKLKYGHRGANQPVKALNDGRVYITSQNHGYAVSKSGLDTDVFEISFINANDGTIEGITYKNHPAFSVQFHPEACGGPLDTEFLFDQFITLIEKAGGKN